jgi:hypothetical protein
MECFAEHAAKVKNMHEDLREAKQISDDFAKVCIEETMIIFCL